MPADVVQSLWIGPRLSAMERLSLASFLRHGHAVHLYTYGEVEGVPEGVVIRDGREILPAERIFYYRDYPSVSGFSNFFRYKLLLERGGWWVDTDMVCLRPLRFEDAHVFASELSRGGQFVTTGAIKAPAGSEAMSLAWEVCESKNPADLKWGETGPSLLADVIAALSLDAFVQPPEVFCPLSYPEWQRVLDAEPPALPDAAVTLHLWNEMWRRNGRDKDAAQEPACLYERLKRENQCAVETWPGP
ncbi:MAG: hypothetical protein QOH21_2633 [Acidobacteriota bacterium]|jgi:hypothetical protein|nr:hypothetical protein [Acidobacteriota bacterium]